MNVIIRPAAEGDLEEAFAYYESQRSGLGLGIEFVIEFRRATDRILTFPRAWQRLDDDHRRCRLHRFHYGIIYMADEGAEQVVVKAVDHLSRHPDRWRKRHG